VVRPTQIREVKVSDFDRIVKYWCEFYDEVIENPLLGITLLDHRPSLTEEFSWFSDIYKQILEGNAIVTIVEEGAMIVGLCEVVRLRSDSEVSHRAELGITIAKEFRGRGIGTSLLQETLRRCRGKFEIIEFSVMESNVVATKLYKKFGFQIIGARDQSIKRKGQYIDEILMSLKL
jgi:RimJ/RimL family protein N-acetyltransferase